MRRSRVTIGVFLGVEVPPKGELCICEVVKELGIKELSSESAVKALDGSVLPGRSRLDESALGS